jgi:hypothetical protein
MRLRFEQVRRDVAENEEVRQYHAESDVCPPDSVPLRGLPRGWCALRFRVHVDLPVTLPSWCKEWLHYARLHLIGGLRVGRQTWMAGAGPTVLVRAPDVTTVCIDGRFYAVIDRRVTPYQAPCLWDWVSLSGSHSLRPGVYRTVETYPAVWVYVSSALKSGMQARLLDPRNPDHRWIAQWLELARSHRLHLRYDTASRILAIPDVSVSLPVLIDRALRLASGTCPSLVTHDLQRYLAFANIGRHRARQAARVLGLRLETVHG